jgi:predicted short-subunit dehydrogenase-like oxidoreductase (DUF2520 family)
MASQELRLLVVGDGRLATHWLRYLSASSGGFSQVLHWARSRDSELDLSQRLNLVTHVFLAISDRALEPFLDQHAASLRGKAVLHASGALDLSAAAQRLQLSVHSTHPLFSFSHHDISTETYATIPLALDADGPPLDELWPGLRNPAIRIKRELRPLYHALCVLMGNGTVLLWEEGLRLAQADLELEPAAFLPYLESVGRNLAASLAGGSADTRPTANSDADSQVASPALVSATAGSQAKPWPRPSALTGPWARGDQPTIDRNRAALSSPALAAVAQVYDSLWGLQKARAKLAAAKSLAPANPTQAKSVRADLATSKTSGDSSTTPASRHTNGESQ